jgi:hypothetical protein
LRRSCHRRSQRPENCDLYLPGHCTHWIQLRKASAERYDWGRLVTVDDDVITVAYLGGVGRYRNHRAETLLDIAVPGTKVAVCERYRTLRIDVGDLASKWFCIAGVDDPWTPCSYEPLTAVSPEALADRLTKRGGFSVPARFLLR